LDCCKGAGDALPADVADSGPGRTEQPCRTAQMEIRQPSRRIGAMANFILASGF
jgi:hypothetical protein